MDSCVHPAVLKMVFMGTLDRHAAEVAAPLVEWGPNCDILMPASLKVLFIQLDTVSLVASL